MRCTCCTASSNSISRISKSILAPTAPKTVCCSPVERCTSNPRITRRSITLSICCSLAPGCIAIIMVFKASPLFVHFKVKFSFAGGGRLGPMDLLLLQLAHHVDNALEDVLYFAVGKRAFIGLLHALEDAFLALRFIDGKVGIIFQLPDFACRRCPPIDQIYELEVQLIDFLTPVFDGHFTHAPRGFARTWLSHAARRTRMISCFVSKTLAFCD